MKIKVSLKDPDTMHDSVDDAFKRLPRPEGIEADEWDDLRDERAAKVKSAISETWMEYGEYLVVEFDTDAKTARVVPIGEK